MTVFPCDPADMAEQLASAQCGGEVGSARAGSAAACATTFALATYLCQLCAPGPKAAVMSCPLCLPRPSDANVFKSPAALCRHLYACHVAVQVLCVWGGSRGADREAGYDFCNYSDCQVLRAPLQPCWSVLGGVTISVQHSFVPQ